MTAEALNGTCNYGCLHSTLKDPEGPEYKPHGTLQGTVMETFILLVQEP